MSAKEIASRWKALMDARPQSIFEHIIVRREWKKLKRVMDNNLKLRLLATKELRLLEIEECEHRIKEAKKQIEILNKEIEVVDKQNAS